MENRNEKGSQARLGAGKSWFKSTELIQTLAQLELMDKMAFLPAYCD